MIGDREASLAIWAGAVADVDGRRGPSTILLTDGRITALEPGIVDLPALAVLDARSEIVTPGLIDLHTHGGAGVQTIDGDLDGLQRLARYYAEHGVTGFLGTVGGSNAHIELGIVGLTRLIGRGRGAGGARCLGIHLEGPFISCCCPGAFRPESIVGPDLATFERYAMLADGALRMITLAPEVAGMAAVIDAAVARAVVCSAGHSAATEVEALAAIDRGVTSMTHLFNAMPGLHHRRPGILGVGLTEPAVTVEAIADGVHLHPRILRLLAAAKGTAGVALITDSIAAAGLADGTYEFEEQEIVVADGSARLRDGTLAGSTLTMDRAVRIFAESASIPWEESIVSATATPARVLGLDHRLGKVAVGYDADLVGFDAEHDVVWTMVAGAVIHRS